MGDSEVLEDHLDADGELVDLAGDSGDAVELCADHFGDLGHAFADVPALIGQGSLGQWRYEGAGDALHRLHAVHAVDGIGQLGERDQVGRVAHVVIGFDEQQVRVQHVRRQVPIRGVQAQIRLGVGRLCRPFVVADDIRR